MADIIDEPDLWLQSQTAVASHILDLVKRNQLASEGDIHDGSTPRKKKNCPVYHRLDLSQSVFGIDILGNPNIQDPAHVDAIKFRRRFRVPYSVFAIIVDLFRSRDEWNPARSTAPGAPSPHPLEIKVLCALFILGRGTDLDTVSMLHAFQSEF